MLPGRQVSSWTSTSVQIRTSVTLVVPVQTQRAPSPAPVRTDTELEVMGNVRKLTNVLSKVLVTKSAWCKETWGNAITRRAATDVHV